MLEGWRPASLQGIVQGTWSCLALPDMTCWGTCLARIYSNAMCWLRAGACLVGWSKHQNACCSDEGLTACANSGGCSPVAANFERPLAFPLKEFNEKYSEIFGYFFFWQGKQYRQNRRCGASQTSPQNVRFFIIFRYLKIFFNILANISIF